MLQRTRFVVLAVLARRLRSSASSWWAAPSTRPPSTSTRRRSPPAPRFSPLPKRLGIDVGRSVAGPFWILAALLAVLVISFLVVRASLRARAARAPDAGRRSFLRGSAGGAAAAVAATALAGVAAWARAFKGVGNDGRGWGPVFREISRRRGGEDAPRVARRVEGEPRAGAPSPRAHRLRGLGHRRRRRRASPARRARRSCASPSSAASTTSTPRPTTRPPGARRRSAARSAGTATRLFLATKFCTPRGHLGPGTSVAEYVGLVEASLRRLGTDYVDLVHVHSCDEVERLLDPNMHEAFDRLREQGKARFLGFSSHTPNLVQVADAAIALGPLRRDDARLPPRHLAAARRGDRARARARPTWASSR